MNRAPSCLSSGIISIKAADADSAIGSIEWVTSISQAPSRMAKCPSRYRRVAGLRRTVRRNGITGILSSKSMSRVSARAAPWKRRKDGRLHPNAGEPVGNPQVPGMAVPGSTAHNAPMSQQQHTWGREQRRDGASEWPSTSFSTLSGELRETRSSARRRLRQRRAGYLRMAVPFLLAMMLGGVGVLALARHFHG